MRKCHWKPDGPLVLQQLGKPGLLSPRIGLISRSTEPVNATDVWKIYEISFLNRSALKLENDWNFISREEMEFRYSETKENWSKKRLEKERY